MDKWKHIILLTWEGTNWVVVGQLVEGGSHFKVEDLEINNLTRFYILTDDINRTGRGELLAVVDYGRN